MVSYMVQAVEACSIRSTIYIPFCIQLGGVCGILYAVPDMRVLVTNIQYLVCAMNYAEFCK